MSAAAGILFLDQDRALLVQPSYKQHWDIPGGIVEPGESPRDAAARELKEELGVVFEVGRLLVVDNVVSPRGLLTAFIFEGGYLHTPDIAVDGDEILDWAWCDAAERADRTVTAPIFAARLAMAIDAALTGRTRYLEHRVP